MGVIGDCDPEDLMSIGEKVVEMADRARSMHAACPGAFGSWRFEMDGTRYRVSVSVETEGEEVK